MTCIFFVHYIFACKKLVLKALPCLSIILNSYIAHTIHKNTYILYNYLILNLLYRDILCAERTGVIWKNLFALGIVWLSSSLCAFAYIVRLWQWKGIKTLGLRKYLSFYFHAYAVFMEMKFFFCFDGDSIIISQHIYHFGLAGELKARYCMNI